METYYLKCIKNTKNVNSKIIKKKKKGRLIMHSKRAECGFKTSRFLKEEGIYELKHR